jgi:hypothetical protein
MAALGAWIFATALVAIPMMARYRLGRAKADAIYKPSRVLVCLAVGFAVLTTAGTLDAADRASRGGRAISF